MNQKTLLEWHYLFGHLGLRQVWFIFWYFPFATQSFSVQLMHPTNMWDLWIWYCRSKETLLMNKSQTHEGSIKKGVLHPVTTVSIDHFELQLLGWMINSYGESSAAKLVGGCIFVDHASVFLHVEHQVGFYAVETFKLNKVVKGCLWNMGMLFRIMRLKIR